MQPIPLLVALLLGLALLTYVLHPLYRHPAPQSESARQAGPQGLSEREQNARLAIQEVELDFQLGNLDADEYRSLRSRYMRRALIEMKSRRQKDQEIDEEIEKQLQTLKESKGQLLADAEQSGAEQDA